MKKSILIILFLILSYTGLNVAALAASDFFTDEAQFSSWYADSAKKMAYNKIMTGYPDGSFQASNLVTRSELAVILDRFAENVVEKKLAIEPSICTMQFEYGLLIHLQDQNGQPLQGAKVTTSPKSEEFFEGEEGIYSGLGEKEGYFTVKIEKSGYTAHAETVKLERDTCHVIPQERTFTLIKL